MAVFNEDMRVKIPATVEIVEFIKEKGVHLVSNKENIDSSTPNGS